MENHDSAIDDQRVRLRSYQQEMLDESMKRNVIVAMDTGSGKTHVAIARIQAELERSQPDKVSLTSSGSPIEDLTNLYCHSSYGS